LGVAGARDATQIVTDQMGGDVTNSPSWADLLAFPVERIERPEEIEQGCPLKRK
jgi:hypothetical protein